MTHPRLRALPPLLFGAALAIAGCTQEEEPPPMDQLPVGALVAVNVSWSSNPAGIGSVQAVAEADTDVAVYSDTGVAVFADGVPLGSDASVKSIHAAAAVPALGLPATWLLGIDADGHIYRLRSRTILDEVTDLFGLAGRPVREVAVAAADRTAFTLGDGSVAVVAGTTASIYPVPLHGMVGGGGRLAARDEQGVVIFQTDSGAVQHHDLPGCVGVALAPDGKLWATTAASLYAERSGALARVYDAEPGVALGGLAAAGDGIWVQIGDGLGLVRRGQIFVGPPGVLSAGARLVGSPTGDVWVIADGKLSRFGRPDGGGVDRQLFRERLLPIYARLCQGCHQPGGSAHIDLSTYSAWAARRARIGQRVLDRTPTPMPPAGTGTLTDGELADLRAWVARDVN